MAKLDQPPRAPDNTNRPARAWAGSRDRSSRGSIERRFPRCAAAVARLAAGLRSKVWELGSLVYGASIVLALSVSNVTGQTRSGELIYATRAICEDAKLLSPRDCESAFANANAELDEKAPRFGKRSECERHFRHCMIGDIHGGEFGGKVKPRVSFMPALRGISISSRSGANRKALPLVEGDDGNALFESRSVSEADTMKSAEKTRRAEAAWARRQIAAPAAANVAIPVQTQGEADVEPTRLDPACAALVDALAYNACLARAGPKSKP